MAKKSIIWSNRANVELKETLMFYIERNGNANYSNKLLSNLENLLDNLSHFENIGRLTNDKKTRVIAMEVYSIFYTTTEN